MQGAIARMRGSRRITNSEISTRSGDWLKDGQLLEAEASYLAAPYLDDETLRNCRIIHLVRDPLKVIGSFVFDLKYFQPPESSSAWNRFIYQHLPHLPKLNSPVEQAASYYVEWNRMIEGACSRSCNPFLFHRIEDGVENLLTFVEATSRDNVFTNQNENSKKGETSSPLALSGIPEGNVKERLIEVGRQYGYSLLP
jgi:hypothetical protein